MAVYDAAKKRERAVCVKLLHAGRVDFVAEADYRADSRLSRRVELLLDAIIAGVAYRKEAFECIAENPAPAAGRAAASSPRAGAPKTPSRRRTAR